MSATGIILSAGIVLLLSAPVVALLPLFTPLASGCPCPEGLGYRTPFGGSGIVIGGVGVAMISLGSFQRRKKGPSEQVAGSPNEKIVNVVMAVVGVALLVFSAVISSIEFRGPGWVILPYGGEGFYLEALGIGMLLFAGFVSVTKRRMNSLFLAVGIILCGMAILFSLISYSEFLLRCSPDVGCSAELATSTVVDTLNWGYILAVGAFLLGVGLTSLWVRKLCHET